MPHMSREVSDFLIEMVGDIGGIDKDEVAAMKRVSGYLYHNDDSVTIEEFSEICREHPAIEYAIVSAANRVMGILPNTGAIRALNLVVQRAWNETQNRPENKTLVENEGE